MENSRLHLVGTIHIDIDGENRLDDLLRRVSPDVIALEMAEDRLRSLDMDLGEARTKMEEAFFKAKLTVPESVYSVLLNPSIKIAHGFEMRSSLRHAERTGAKINYIDMPMGNFEDLNDIYIGMIEELSYRPNFFNQFVLAMEEASKNPDDYLRTLASIDYDKQNYFLQMREAFNNPAALAEQSMSPEQIEASRLVFDEKRDIHMAEKIRNHFNEHTTLVGIVGVHHLPGISSRLSDLNPNVMTLKEYALRHGLD